MRKRFKNVVVKKLTATNFNEFQKWSGASNWQGVYLELSEQKTIRGIRQRVDIGDYVAQTDKGMVRLFGAEGDAIWGLKAGNDTIDSKGIGRRLFLTPDT